MSNFQDKQDANIRAVLDRMAMAPPTSMTTTTASTPASTSKSAAQCAKPQPTSRNGHVDATVGSDFIPSTTWQGAKTGYYFGTNSRGTGYYRDNYAQQQHGTKRKRGVRIAEENNEMRLVPTKLLEEAEKKASGSTVIELTPKGLQSASNALVKIVNQNAMQRVRFAHEPRNYMQSELALYEQLTALQAVAADVKLYSHIVKNEGLLPTLTQLLGHENVDVCASVIALLLEWLDPSLLQDHDEELATTLGNLAKRMLEEAWESVVLGLVRFSEQQINEQDNDTQDQTLKGIDNGLDLIENLLELDLLIAGGIFAEKRKLSAAGFMVNEAEIVSWLFQQVVSENSREGLKSRCMELLAFLSQRDDVFKVLPDWSKLPNIPASGAAGRDHGGQPLGKRQKDEKEPVHGIEILLQAVGTYRKKQPETDDEVEFLENACITLSSCITFSRANLSVFLDGQGIELVLRCLKERVHAGASTLKLLDFFGGKDVHKRACEHLVEAGGLKYLFPIFLKARIPKPSPSQVVSAKSKKEWLQKIESQIIRIFFALSRHLDDKSPFDAKARFLTKFLEDDRKCDRLVELLLTYDQKARKAEYLFFRSDFEEEFGGDEATTQLAALDTKLKGGGDLFHRLGAIAAFVCANSKRCHERILSQLQLQRSGISLVKVAVEEFARVLGSGSQQKLLESLLKSI